MISSSCYLLTNLLLIVACLSHQANSYTEPLIAARISRSIVSLPSSSTNSPVAVSSSSSSASSLSSPSSQDNLKKEGPIFTREPANRIVFSNSTGTVINCKAKGNPFPEIYWELSDGSRLIDVPGLRHSMPDGSLLLHPFPGSKYSQDIHAAIYRCVASNSFGKIRSRNVHLRAVVHQPYKIQVHDVFVIKGNAALFHCHVPSFVKDFVNVIAWFKDDAALITSTSPKATGRFNLLPNGDLYIRNTSFRDTGSYVCELRDQLTGETTRSSFPGRLRVTEPTGPMPPRIVYNSNSLVTVSQGSFAQICCVAQAYPLPQFSWFKEDETGSSSRILASENIEPKEGCLIFHETQLVHSIRYICQVSNVAGEERSMINLHVESPLHLTLSPSSIVADIGKPAQFICQISSQRPDTAIIWLKDGHQVALEFGSVYLNRSIKISTYTIDSVSRDSIGMYQCFAANEQESAQASGSLRLGDIAPLILEAFSEIILEPGSPLSIRCIIVGSPLPEVKWSLEDRELPFDSRVQIGGYVNRQGQIVSYLNISSTEIIDGGEYRCSAINDVGKSEASSIIYIVGEPRLVQRTSSSIADNITLIAGRDASIRCPVIGYPIDFVHWKHRDQSLPINHRQKIERFSNKDHRSILRIENVQKHHDDGEYSCFVKGSDGKTVKGTIHLTVKVAPLIDVQPLPGVIYANEGMRVKLVCSIVEGDQPVTIKWLKKGIPLRLTSNIVLQNSDDYSLLTFKKTVFTDSGNYTCSAHNSVETDQRTTQLIVNVPPKWNLEPNNQSTVVYGHKVLINCSSHGFPRPRISWKKSTGHLISGSSSSSISDRPTEFKDILSNYRHQVYSNGTLVIQEADKSDSGFYMCQSNNGIGAGLSKVVLLKVQMPPHFETKFISLASKKGDKTILNCAAQGDLPLKIVWQKDKHEINFKTEKRFSLIETTNEANDGLTSLLEIYPTTRQDSALFTCQASNDFGHDDTNIQLIVMERPETPAILTIEKETSRTALVRWKASFSGNSPILYYIIEYSEDGPVKEWTEVKTSRPDSEAIIKSLKPVTAYKVRVKAVNAIGVSEASPVVNFKTGEEVPGGPPLDVRLEASGSQSLKVKWKAPKKELRFGKIKGYYIGYKIAEASDSYNYKNIEIENEADNETELSAYITNLKRRTTYEIIVQAYNSVGTGPRSDEISMTTLQNSPPTTPLLKYLTSTYDSITIGWSLDDIDSSNSQRDYVLCYKTENGFEWIKKEITRLKLNEYTIDSLKCGTKYAVYLIAKNSLGIGEPSKTIIARTKGGAPVSPSTIKHFAVINSTWIQINLGKWLDSGCQIHKFLIKYKSWNSKQWIHFNKPFTLGAKVVTINTLTPGKQYDLSISASSDAGTTEAEYTFVTWNLSLPYPNLIGSTKHGMVSQAPASSSFIIKQYVAILLPIIISVFMLITLLSIILFCLKKQSIFFDNDTNNNMMIEASNFDRISCNSTAYGKSCEINSENVPLSDYQTVTKFKPIDETTHTVSYYSSPNRKITKPLATAVSIPMVIKGSATHDYAEPFVQFAPIRRLSTPGLDDYDKNVSRLNEEGTSLPGLADVHMAAQYASIKKNQTIRPSSLFNAYNDKK